MIGHVISCRIAALKRAKRDFKTLYFYVFVAFSGFFSFASFEFFRWASLCPGLLLIFIIFSYWGSPLFTCSFRTACCVGPSLERASLWRNDVEPSTSPVGLENSATMATTARRWTGTQWTWPRLGIWRIFICSRCFCCSPIALVSDESLAPSFLSLLSTVSLPVVVVPRCILTEASALGSALHLITTITVAASFASSVS